VVGNETVSNFNSLQHEIGCYNYCKSKKMTTNCKHQQHD